MNNYKRLFKLLKGKKKHLVASILLIIIIQLLGFISPLIVKTILDDCIMGIEYDWVEVISNDSSTVKYNDKYYKQTRHLDESDVVISDASIVIYKSSFYFVNDKVEDGHRKITNNILEIKKDNLKYQYEVSILTSKQITSFYKPIYKTLLIFLILLFIKMILNILCTFIEHIITNNVISSLAQDGRTLAMKSIEFLPISYFEEEQAGKMASRITQDVDGFITLYRQLINLFANVSLSFIFAYIGMFYLNYKLALLSFAFYPLIILWIKVFMKWLKKIAIKVNESRSMLSAKINEVINGINILQVFNYKKQTVDEFNQISMNYKEEQLKEVKLSTTLGWNMINIAKAIITTGIVMYFGLSSFTISNVVITAGTIYAYNEYLLKIIEPINIIFSQINMFSHSHVQMDRIHKLIEGKKEDSEVYDIPKTKGNIKFDNVWFAYHDKDYVLKGISFEIKAGEMIGLVGHTGSGKSSLMNLLLRFYDLNDELSGNIYIDDTPIDKYSKRSFRKQIGIVLQDPVLIKGTIADNVRFGNESITDEEIKDTIIKLGGKNILDKFANGIFQEIARSGTNLSVGEKQIISLARAFVNNPQIIIMDEATSHIDIETESMIQEALKVVCENRTVIVIAHRLSTIFNADKIIVLDHGLKVEEGTHYELLKNNSVYANIYRAQVANINVK